MARITSNVGLVSGLPIADIVDQLIEVSALPRRMLNSRTEGLKNQQIAIGSLSSKLLSLQFDLGKLKTSSIYSAKKTASSDPAVLSATIASGAQVSSGSYRFTPVRVASAQQLVSQRFESKETTFAAQSFAFRTGGFVNQGVSLDALNSGLGVRSGEIRITDKSGQSTTVDLRFASTVDDVVDAINASTSVNVSASILGDRFQIVDNTGQSGTLSIQEVNNGTTAADLGLLGMLASGSDTTILGSDVYRLHGETRLSHLNDGNGVWLGKSTEGIDDLIFTLADGAPAVGIDLTGAPTLGAVVNAINTNEQLAGRVSASISADGNRLELTDHTTGAGTFAVSNGLLGTAADDLGLSQQAVGNQITGARLTAGMRDTLLSSLGGGKGIESPGNLEITNRAGILSTIDLSGAETLGELVAAINLQAVGIAAEINSSRSGILVKDTTGATSSNLIVANGVGSTVADDLRIASDQAANAVDSGSLHRQTMSKATLLSSLNGGAGITTIGDISVTNSLGVRKSIDVNPGGVNPKTVGEIIDLINASGAEVEARINDNGDGIVLIDKAGGPGKLSVTNVSGSLATDLRLNRESIEQELDGVVRQVLDGTAASRFSIEAGDTLEQVAGKINAAKGGVTASIINDGTGVRLSLSVNKSGAANSLLLDLGATSFQFEQVSAAQDALLRIGDGKSGGLLVSSKSNSFTNVIDGVTLNVTGTSSTPVTIDIDRNDSSFVTAVEAFVEAYNSFRAELASLTDFNENDLSTGLLFGTNEALRVDTQLARLVTDRFHGLGEFQNLRQLGISANSNGNLELDTVQLRAAFASNPASVETFFTDKERGVLAKFNSTINQLAGGDNTLLANRYDSLQATIENNERRISQLDDYLERQRETLLMQFYQLERIVADFQASSSALASFQPLPPMTSLRRNN